MAANDKWYEIGLENHSPVCHDVNPELDVANHERRNGRFAGSSLRNMYPRRHLQYSDIYPTFMIGLREVLLYICTSTQSVGSVNERRFPFSLSVAHATASDTFVSVKPTDRLNNFSCYFVVCCTVCFWAGLIESVCLYARYSYMGIVRYVFMDSTVVEWE